MSQKVLVDERLVHPGTGAVLNPGEIRIMHNDETGETLFIARCEHHACAQPFLVLTRPPGMNAGRCMDILERRMRDHNARYAVSGVLRVVGTPE